MVGGDSYITQHTLLKVCIWNSNDSQTTGPSVHLLVVTDHWTTKSNTSHTESCRDAQGNAFWGSCRNDKMDYGLNSPWGHFLTWSAGTPNTGCHKFSWSCFIPCKGTRVTSETLGTLQFAQHDQVSIPKHPGTESSVLGTGSAWLCLGRDLWRLVWQ